MFTKKKLIDKVRVVSLEPVYKSNTGEILCRITYDVRKLRRMKLEMLESLLMEKTLNLYPFAIIHPGIGCGVTTDYAVMNIVVPLHPGMHTDPIQ